MSLVLAIEPDSAQADPLTSLVRAKLGAQLQLVASTRAAIVAINQRVPDVILLGRDVPQEQRTKVVTHLRSIVGEDGQVRTVDIPHLTSPQTTETFGKQIGVCLASAEDAGCSRRRPRPPCAGRPTGRVERCNDALAPPVGERRGGQGVPWGFESSPTALATCRTT